MSRRERRCAAALQAALAQLPEQQRAVFDAVAVEGKSYTATALQLSISADEVEHQLAAALIVLDMALATSPPPTLRQRLGRLLGREPST